MKVEKEVESSGLPLSERVVRFEPFRALSMPSRLDLS